MNPINITVTTAQYCENGDLITLDIRDPYSTENFCSICGAKTITCCPHCGKPIIGKSVDLVENDYFGTSRNIVTVKSRPSHCSSCGEMFPWAETASNTIRDILIELEDVNPEEVQRTIDLIPDIISVTPRTDLAKIRLRKIYSAAGDISKNILKSMIVKYACDAIRSFFGF